MNTNRAVEAVTLARVFEGVTEGVAPATEITTRTVPSDSPNGESTTTLTASGLLAAAAILREQAEGLTLGEQQQRDLNNAVGCLPYGGLLPRWRVEDVDDMVSLLRSFADVLRGVAERNDRTEQQLRELKRQREGFRAFIGIDDLQRGLDENALAVASLQGDVESMREGR